MHRTTVVETAQSIGVAFSTVRKTDEAAVEVTKCDDEQESVVRYLRFPESVQTIGYHARSTERRAQISVPVRTAQS